MLEEEFPIQLAFPPVLLFSIVKLEKTHPAIVALKTLWDVLRVTLESVLEIPRIQRVLLTVISALGVKVSASNSRISPLTATVMAEAIVV